MNRFQRDIVLHSLLACLVLISAGATSGCALLGLAASRAPPRTVPPAYDRLAGNSTAVWVWVDAAVDLDYPRLSLDVATRIQKNLEDARDRGNNRQKKELEGMSFPIEPASIVKYQKRDTTLNMAPILQVAPKLDVQRLVYVEVPRFTTQGGAAPGLLRGVSEISISVVEIDRQTKQARMGYQEQGLRLAFPPDGPAQGSSTLDERSVYQGLALRIADEASMRFVSHPEQERR